MLTSRVIPILLSLLAFAVFVAHTYIFKDWIVDDAGILYSYARNIAMGHGIVAQPGVLPVEGCSDFLWMMLFVPFFLTDGFDPMLTPKIFSAFIVFILFLISFFNLRNHLSNVLIFLFLLLLALATPFAVWSSGGLENPLYILLIAVYFFYTLKAFERNEVKDFTIAAILAFLISITRPEGIMYGFALPVAMFFVHILKGRERQFNSGFKSIVIYLLLFAGLYVSFLIFRFSYFGDWVPNTYYFKGGPDISDIWKIILLKESAVLKLQHLFSSVVFQHSFLCMFLFTAVNCWIYFTQRYNLFHAVLTVFFVFGILNFLLLPVDGMGEFRFATPFLYFFYLFLISTLYILLSGLRFNVSITSALLTVFMLATFQDFQKRSWKYAHSPWVPFNWIAQDIAQRFNRYADALNLKNASLLTADCGATLFYSKLRVYDMAGLVDKRYAVTTIGKDKEGFNNLVLETDKPTFVQIHGDWAYNITLQQDPRFLRDYVPITEYRWNLYGKDITDGIYIRREVINNNTDLLKKLK